MKDREAPGARHAATISRFSTSGHILWCMPFLAFCSAPSKLLESAWTKIDDVHRLSLFAHPESVALNSSLEK
jgi:hypothetical protein